MRRWTGDAPVEAGATWSRGEPSGGTAVVITGRTVTDGSPSSWHRVLRTMERPEALLIDVYETILTCDFRAHATELPALAGIPAQQWNAAFVPLGPALTDGRMTVARAFEHVLATCGRPPTADILDALCQRDRQLMVRWSRLFDDTAPFLRMARERGLRTVLVSNCSDTTRYLLEHLGVDELVDAMVLSCETGAAKPAPEIYKRALQEADATPGSCLFLDDQARYCAGALDLGILAVQVARGTPVPGYVHEVADGAPVVKSFVEVEKHL